MAVELAADLASFPPLALAAAKRLLSEGVTVDLATAVHLERSTVATLFDSEDRVEGHRRVRGEASAALPGLLTASQCPRNRGGRFSLNERTPSA